MDDKYRNFLVAQIPHAEEQLRLYDLAQTPLPHAEDCPCPLGACTLRRIDAVGPIFLTDDERDAMDFSIEESHAFRCDPTGEIATLTVRLGEVEGVLKDLAQAAKEPIDDAHRGKVKGLQEPAPDHTPYHWLGMLIVRAEELLKVKT